MRYMTDGDWNSFWRVPFIFIQLPRLSLAPCACRLSTRLLAAMTMQPRPSNANLKIISPVHNAAKNFRRNIRACIYPVTSEVTQINTCAVSLYRDRCHVAGLIYLSRQQKTPCLLSVRPFNQHRCQSDLRTLTGFEASRRCTLLSLVRCCTI
jgi:hypothetical protein